MHHASVLACLGGLVDGDGYFKITKNYRTPGTKHPYYATVLGLAQLWPGVAVRIFADTLGGEVKQVLTQRGTRMARFELGGKMAESAARRLAPFLLAKRTQALLFLEALRLRPKRHGRTLGTERGHEDVEKVAQALVSVQGGLWNFSTGSVILAASVHGYGSLTPLELGWTRQEILAYLAGVMDSDGNFRISRQRVSGMRWPHYRTNIRCAQVIPSPAIGLLAQTFGGRISTKRGRKPNHRDLTSWNLHDRAASPAIEALLPYLRVKWAEACLLLELRHLKSLGKEDLTEWQHWARWQRPINMRKRSYSARQVAEFERVRQTLLALHEVGRSLRPSVPARPGSAAYPTSACSSLSRSRSPRADRSG